VKLAPDAGSVALFEPDGKLDLWNLRTDVDTTISTAGAEPIVDCLFTRNGNYLVTFVQAPTNIVARSWDVRRARPAGSFALERPRCLWRRPFRI